MVSYFSHMLLLFIIATCYIGAASSSNDMQVDDEVISDTEENEKVNMANAVDLSESEDEEELEDIVDDFAPSDRIQDDVRTLHILLHAY